MNSPKNINHNRELSTSEIDIIRRRAVIIRKVAEVSVTSRQEHLPALLKFIDLAVRELARLERMLPKRLRRNI